MILKRRCYALLLPFLLAVVGGGCGGGASTPETVPSVATRQVDVFVTDGFSDDYAQVWVTLYKIEAGQNGVFTTVYDTTEGKTINLTALKVTTQFLSSISLPDVAYDTLRITFGDTITLTPPNGAASSEVLVEARENLTVAGGKAALTLHESTRNVLEKGNRPLVMDFNLAAFTLIGGKVRPEVKPDAPSDFETRESVAELTGTVTELQPGREFRLQLPSPANTRVRILLNGDTKIVDASGQDATLANGQSVFVRGTHNKTGQSVTAINIRLLNGDSHRLQTYQGTVVEVNEAASSFVVAVREGTERLARERLIVLTNPRTIFRKLASTSGGSTNAVFGDLRVGQSVTVTGELDADRLRLTALRVEIHEREIPPIVETARGTVLEVGGDRFVIGVSEASPISLTTGVRLTVVTNASTTYRKASGTASYADIKVGAVVRATGALNTEKTQLAASVIEIVQEAPTPVVKTTLVGTIAERNESARTFILVVTESSTTLPQARILIRLTDSTVLRKTGTSGEVAATFADLLNGRSVRAVGELDADKLRLTADTVTVLRL